MEANNVKPWSLTLWGSRPEENDDCHTGEDFDTESAARVCLAEPWDMFAPRHFKTSTAYFLLKGPGTREVIKNQYYKTSKDDYSYERREYAMQQGMGLGIQAYNEACGQNVNYCEDD